MYHEDRRGTRILPLRSYADPPADEMFDGLDFFDFRFDNVCETVMHNFNYSPVDYLSL